MNMKKTVVGTALALTLMATSNAHAISKTEALEEIRTTAAALCQTTDQYFESRFYQFVEDLSNQGVDTSYLEESSSTVIEEITSVMDSATQFECIKFTVNTVTSILYPHGKGKMQQQIR